MKNLSSFLNRAVLAVAGALALGACSRGNYAVLPKAPSYLGSAPIAATPRPAAQPQAATVAASTAEAVATAPAAAPVAPATPPAKSVASAPVAKPVAAAPAPAAAATVPDPAVAPEALATEAPAAKAPAKLSLMQRLALKKVAKKLDKLAAQPLQLKKHDATAGTNRLDGGLRQALLVGIIGLAIILLAAIVNSWLIYVIGSIVLVVALVLLLLYLINQM